LQRAPRDELPPACTVATRRGRLRCCVSRHGSPRALHPEIRRLGTVFAWNRFGLPGSDAMATRQSGVAAIAALREALAQLELRPPWILAGHSLGGLYANLFARLYPQETAAVLLLEATHPRDRELLRRQQATLAHALARVTGGAIAPIRRNVRSELAGVERTVRALRSAGAFPDVPLRVVTGGRSPPPGLMSPAAAGARRAHQQELARLSPRGRQVIAARSGHFPQLTEPALVLRVMRELVAEARCLRSVCQGQA
jgi:pimeloyl-ACP methyl ester carboxylesterase